MSERCESAYGLKVFGSLRAEEEPWLGECFVPPSEFDGMVEARSIIVFGPPGSGKSAVCRMMAAQVAPPHSSPLYLIVRWQPTPPLWEPVAGFESVPGQVAYIFDLCALEVLRFVALYPDRWASAHPWARWLLAWFIRRFLRGDPKIRTAELLEEAPGREIVADLLETERSEDLLPPGDWRLVTVEFVKALQQLRLQGVWVMVDGLEAWLGESRRLLPAFISFLSTLPLFEEEAFAYKVFAPEAFYGPLLTAEGVSRYRFRVYHLSWSKEQLEKIAVRRLALALGRPEISLKDLCRSPQFLKWLRQVGGVSPRIWLESLRPVIIRYLETGKPVPVSEWKRLRNQVVPRITLDEENREVLVGGRNIPMKEIPSGALRILRYLYQNAGRIVPWDELYYKGYRQMERIPHRGEPGYEEPSNYENILYSRLSDLRKKIEPDPKNPVCIETIRDEGVRLRVVW
ncbi:MAG: winged helix-turn-helix domain-containing protein [Anaerolineae bacterium]|nr:winged helix-turn-helix domain-containing protein [Anaerolineae bacterium]